MQLRPFTQDDLPAVEPWFDDIDTRRWLGGREWPRETLDLIRAVSGDKQRLGLVAVDGESLVALADVEISSDGTAATAIVVAPERRSRGMCVEFLSLIVRELRARGARELVGGVHRDNPASRRCVERAGLRALTVKPDADGFVDYALALV